MSGIWRYVDSVLGILVVWFIAAACVGVWLRVSEWPVRKRIAKRLDEFMETWISNPAAQLEFAELINDCLDVHVANDRHELTAVAAWVQEQRDTAQYLGLRKRGKSVHQ